MLKRKTFVVFLFGLGILGKRGRFYFLVKGEIAATPMLHRGFAMTD